MHLKHPAVCCFHLSVVPSLNMSSHNLSISLSPVRLKWLEPVRSRFHSTFVEARIHHPSWGSLVQVQKRYLETTAPRVNSTAAWRWTVYRREVSLVLAFGGLGNLTFFFLVVVVVVVLSFNPSLFRWDTFEFMGILFEISMPWPVATQVEAILACAGWHYTALCNLKITTMEIHGTLSLFFRMNALYACGSWGPIKPCGNLEPILGQEATLPKTKLTYLYIAL